MKNILEGALIANAASMGFNWIYNMPYLDKLSKEQSLVFQPINPAQYERARKSYLAYPNARIGDVSVQGEISKWLYQALADHPNMTAIDYQNLVYEHLKPGGIYEGWVESYGKKLVLNKLNEQLKIDVDVIKYNDDQLVGFIPYLVCKELGLPSSKAWELTQAFTEIKDYDILFQTFDRLFDAIKKTPLKEALRNVIDYAPNSFKSQLQAAIDIKDTVEFITNHSGTACHIPHAIPLIFHILFHNDSYQKAIETNTKIGGASCDRGMLIGAIYGQISEIPDAWKNLTYLK